jgi:DNA-binding NarL/FixJ family response regulator
MLHGRDTELAEIDRLLDGVRAGFSGTLLIQGEAGIGKSALLDSVAERATGMRVMRSVGLETETELAFANLHLLLHPYLHLLDDLPGPQADALRRALGLRYAPAQDRFLVGLGLLTLLSDLADSMPTICLIDDAQWVDQASIDALLFAARRLNAEPIALIFATRNDQRSLDVSGLPELVPRPLDCSAAARVLSAHADDLAPHVRDRVIEESEGIPQALIELPTVLTPSQRTGHVNIVPSFERGALPVTGRMLRTYTDQIRALPQQAQTLLAVAAADDTGDPAVVLDAAQHLGASLVDLKDIETQHLIHLSTGRLTFRHPLIRAAAYAYPPTALRLAIHRALADALRCSSSEDRRAWHRAAGATQPDEAVASALERGAENARARGGYAEVAAVYERAAHLSPDLCRRARRLASAAHAALDAGQPQRAGGLADQATRLVEDPLTRAELDQVGAVVDYEHGKLTAAHTKLLRAATGLADVEPLRAAFLALEAMNAAWSLGSDALIKDTLSAISGMDLPQDPAVQLVVHGAAGLAEIFDGKLRHGVAAVRSLVCSINDQRHAISARQRASMGFYALVIGDLRTSCDLALALQEDCRAQGAIGLLPQTMVRLVRAQIALGHHREAWVSATEGLRIAEDTSQDQFVSQLKACLVHIAAIEGDEERCHDLAEEVFSQGMELSVTWCSSALALLDLGLGRYDDALRRLESLQDNPAWRAASLHIISDHAEVAVRLGYRDRVYRPVTWWDTWAAQSRQAWAHAIVMRRHALLASESAAEGCYLEALRLHAQGGSPFERARTTLLFGEWLRRNRRRNDARHQLRIAADIFQRLGARPWQDRARAELRAAGDSHNVTDQGPDLLSRLTPQELQVARLAATGMSNRDIGARLFLSPRTISYHLYKAYPKLGISSRGELAQFTIGATQLAH